MACASQDHEIMGQLVFFVGRLYPELGRELEGRGFTVAGCSEIIPATEPVFREYRIAFSRPGVTGYPVLIGFGEGADLIARSYYDFYAIRPPIAVVLLSPSVRPIHLNNLTCPYLIVHGATDPLFQAYSYGWVESAVHHHQMRYGDLTTRYLFQDLGRDLGGEQLLSPEVHRLVLSWLPQAAAQGNRPQEPAAGAAA